MYWNFERSCIAYEVTFIFLVVHYVIASGGLRRRPNPRAHPKLGVDLRAGTPRGEKSYPMRMDLIYLESTVSERGTCALSVLTVRLWMTSQAVLGQPGRPTGCANGFSFQLVSLSVYLLSLNLSAVWHTTMSRFCLYFRGPAGGPVPRFVLGLTLIIARSKRYSTQWG